ncbi:MAG: hypothetical protein ACOC1H_04490, partial [Desulfosalsimonas sp.]
NTRAMDPAAPGRSGSDVSTSDWTWGYQPVYNQFMTTNKPKTKQLRTALHFYLIRLPGVFLLAPLGFILEFVVTFPWKLAVAIDNRWPGHAKKVNRN